MKIVPFGKMVYVNDFKGDNYFIRKLTPAERVLEIKDGMQKIIGDPIYFSLFTPRKFDQAVLSIKYKTFGDELKFKTIEVGALVDNKLWRYNLRPLENFVIDKFIKEWDATRDGDIILLQRPNLIGKKYETVDAFLQDLPEVSKIALYNYELKREYILSDYAPQNELKKVLPNTLRGAYQFYTYIKDEDLYFKFNFFDLNKNKDADEIDVFLYYNNELLEIKHLDDDGIVIDNNRSSAPRDLEISLKNLPEGSYKIEFRANDDIITNEIITSQQKISFENNLWFYENGRKNITLYTDSNKIWAKVVSPQGLQKITAGANEIIISETYKQFETALSGTSMTLKKLNLQKDGIIISGNGNFIFRESQFINSKIKKVSEFGVNEEGVDYILANYQSPREEGEWKIANVELDISAAYRENGNYGFLISLPGLKADDKIMDGIEIDWIKIELRGKNLYDKIFK
ncbi:MAG: hypothetical protein ABH881_00670 [bacterium]